MVAACTESKVASRRAAHSRTFASASRIDAYSAGNSARVDTSGAARAAGAAAVATWENEAVAEVEVNEVVDAVVDSEVEAEVDEEVDVDDADEVEESQSACRAFRAAQRTCSTGKWRRKK